MLVVSVMNLAGMEVASRRLGRARKRSAHRKAGFHVVSTYFILVTSLECNIALAIQDLESET